ncbi:MAG: hypothetical protein GTN71_02930 [Anaerolineae bacterium]|nr:hypothetical protein [Anaerolineae bacterium]
MSDNYPDLCCPIVPANSNAYRYYHGLALWNDGYCFGFDGDKYPEGLMMPYDILHVHFKALDLLWKLWAYGKRVKIHNGKRWIWPKYVVSWLQWRMRAGHQEAGKGGTYFWLTRGGADIARFLFGEGEIAEKRYRFLLILRSNYTKDPALKERADRWEGPYAAHSRRETELDEELMSSFKTKLEEPASISKAVVKMFEEGVRKHCVGETPEPEHEPGP